MKDRIKEIRKAENLTQQAFADILGLKQNTVASYEMGRIGVSDVVITSICREFGIREQWLRTGEGKMRKQRDRNQEVGVFVSELMKESDNAFKKRFILALSKLDESEWKVLAKIVDELKEG